VKHRAEEGKKALASRHGEKSGEITQDQDQDDQVLVSVPIRASSQITRRSGTVTMAQAMPV
jgi:hypothetical protein